jgi:Fur family zinc uptake transcriptional regulator
MTTPRALAPTRRQEEELCRVRGVRLVEQRRKVLEVLRAGDPPTGAYEIPGAMRDLAPGAAPPAVYRALGFLRRQGLVHKLEILHA